MQTEVVASIIAAVTALVAVVASPILAARTGKNQMIGPMRQAWINDLRDNLSLYISRLSINRWHGAPSGQESSVEYERKEAEDILRIKEAVRLREKLLLLLNPGEQEHIDLAKLIELAYVSYEKAEDTSEVLIDLRKFSQQVLKKEWDVVKK